MTRDSQGNETQPKDKIVVEPTFALAKDADQVGMVAARAIPEEHLEHLEEIEILVRPFA